MPYLEMNKHTKKTLASVADFFDARKVGDVGPLGFRRSTDLSLLLSCADRLLEEEIIVPGQTHFLDLGCADGRVNVLFSYLVKTSVGIELDDWTLDDYDSLRPELDAILSQYGLLMPPENILLFNGDSTTEQVHKEIKQKTGLGFEEFDLFYTCLVMQDEFATMIAEKAKTGSVFIVYGLNKIMPRFDGLELMENLSPLEGILGLYRKA